MIDQPAAQVAARDLALQRIGRAVVNFQKMEAMLKFLAMFSSVSLPLSSSIETLTDRIAEVSRLTMGNAAREAALGLHTAPDHSLPNTKDISVTLTFDLSQAGSSQEEWHAAIRQVIDERNLLIHQRLARWNPGSPEESEALCAELDVQRERILPIYAHLEALVKEMLSGHRQLAADLPALLRDLAMGTR